MAIDRKEQIFSTARYMFSEKGYQATTVRDIARELNMQAGSLYAHIESKEDVLWQIVDQAAGQFLAAVEPIVAGNGASVEKLRAMVRAHVEVVAGNGGNAAIFRTSGSSSARPGARRWPHGATATKVTTAA